MPPLVIFELKKYNFMRIAEIIKALELFAPTAYQESYDNAKLLTGNKNWECTGILLSLDCLENIVDEAINTNCNLIVAHHPIVFSGLKSFTGKNYIERTVIKALKNDICIYAIHTNLDNMPNGVNHKICEKIGLQNTRILAPKSQQLCKLYTFCPTAEVEKVRKAIFESGAGNIGNYDKCSFNTLGYGTFRGNEKTNAFVGKKGEMHIEEETKIEVIFPSFLQNKIIANLVNAHPYEEVAYDIIKLENSNQNIGSGMIGELETEKELETFLKQIKATFNCGAIKFTNKVKDKIKTVAVCGGAGSFLLNAAKAQKADIFITSDYKYHQFFDADNQIVIADIGHYESEQFTSELLFEYLREKFPNFALQISKINTNPVNYI